MTKPACPPSADPTSRAYEERAYAGVLGKIIGVYLGRPFEGWSHERITRELGEINGYVHERLGQPLVVTDDDISGTFTFLRALAENKYDPNLTSAQVGGWWLNTIIEDRAILWWGGLGMSTEHTAFLRLKSGIHAPDSGSIGVNGRTVAEQIGAQIFIDGWGMVCPGDPERAAHFAGVAARVSHDGEAVYAAQALAALEAAAFAEDDWERLWDAAYGRIPANSIIARLFHDLRDWKAADGDDWRATLRRVQGRYGYDKYGGNCHVVPNHAVILLALLHGNNNFDRSLMIACTSGWDTDCNAGNVGCILGVKNGLAGIDAGETDWRGPVADRLYLPTADGGRAITDALRETYAIVNTARALRGLPPARPKNGARFHFSLPGSVQGFGSKEPNPGGKPPVPGATAPDSLPGKGRREGLLLPLPLAGGGGERSETEGALSASFTTLTFTPPDALTMPGYSLLASPTLYPGQTVTARMEAGRDLTGPVSAGLFLRVYGDADTLSIFHGPAGMLAPGQALDLAYTVPDTGGQPVAEVGVEISSEGSAGSVLLDWLTWDGPPDTTFRRPAGTGTAWQRAWVNAASVADFGWGSPGQFCRVIDNHGIGLVLTGEWEWTDYQVSCEILPRLCRRTGLAAAVRGLRRYLAVVLDEDGCVRLIAQRDAARRVLADLDVRWMADSPLMVSLAVSQSGEITATAGDARVCVPCGDLPLCGGIALLADTGHAEFGPVHVRPV